MDAVRNIVDAVLQAGKTLADMMGDLLALAAADLKEVVGALLAAGVGLKEFVVSALNSGLAAAEKFWAALLAVGRTVLEILQAVYDFARNKLALALQTFLSIGRTMVDILEFTIVAGRAFFVAVGRALAAIGQDALDIVKWAVMRAGEAFDWAMEVYEKVRQTFVDVIMWAVHARAVIVTRVVDWLDAHLGEDFEAFKNRIVVPVLALGKLGLVALIVLGSACRPFRAVVMFVLQRLAREQQTDYHLWPATLAACRTEFQRQQTLLNLPPVDATHKYILVSDLHMDAQDDVDAGIGHFFHNEGLLVSVLSRFAADPVYTLVVVGDEQDFWYNADLDQLESPSKLDAIAATHPAIFATLKQFHQAGRLVKMRGNHDSLYRDAKAVARYRSLGFPNLRVYDYALVKFQQRDLLLMHGQQFDPYNCDANEAFGKFVCNFISEPIDALDAVVKDRFGKRFPGASLEGYGISPYYTPEQREAQLKNKNADKPAIADGATFKETPIVAQVRKFGTSMIMGHTHGPKILKVASAGSGGSSLFYVNIGTCGWWEGAVWTVELQPDDLVLTLWTSGAPGGSPVAKGYKLSEATVTV